MLINKYRFEFDHGALRLAVQDHYTLEWKSFYELYFSWPPRFSAVLATMNDEYFDDRREEILEVPAFIRKGRLFVPNDQFVEFARCAHGV